MEDTQPKFNNTDEQAQLTLWNQDQITEWHKNTFPNATVGGQLAKLNEELNELDKPDSDREKELADLLICAIVLFHRFNSKIGFLLVNSIISQLLGTLRTPVEAEAYLNKIISEKMEINKNRKWKEIEPGMYKHVEESDDRPTEQQTN